MGKNILVQRRGRGYFIFKAPTHRRIHSVGYNSVDGHSSGYVKDLLHEMARGAPLALLKVEGAGEIYVPAPEGIAVGQKLLFGSEVPAEIGNIKTLGKMPEGTMICNIELRHGGGRHKHAGKPTTVGRWTSPGRKVGNIAARQTGRAKRRSAR